MFLLSTSQIYYFKITKTKGALTWHQDDHILALKEFCKPQECFAQNAAYRWKFIPQVAEGRPYSPFTALTSSSSKAKRKQLRKSHCHPSWLWVYVRNGSALMASGLPQFKHTGTICMFCLRFQFARVSGEVWAVRGTLVNWFHSLVFIWLFLILRSHMVTNSDSSNLLGHSHQKPPNQETDKL